MLVRHRTFVPEFCQPGIAADASFWPRCRRTGAILAAAASALALLQSHPAFAAVSGYTGDIACVADQLGTHSLVVTNIGNVALAEVACPLPAASLEAGVLPDSRAVTSGSSKVTIIVVPARTPASGGTAEPPTTVPRGVEAGHPGMPDRGIIALGLSGTFLLAGSLAVVLSRRRPRRRAR